MIHGYPSVYAVGHGAIQELFRGDVLVEEKVDGSQFSMCRTAGALECRSKGQQIVVDAPEGMFAKAVDTAKRLDLHDGWVYRAEYLQKPKHNALCYGRVPTGNLIVFDIMPGQEQYLDYDAKAAEAARIGLECVPRLFCGVIDNVDTLRALLDRESVLGGCKVEGVVIKNYQVFTAEKKVAVGKVVSEAFKEKLTHEWKKANPTGKDIVGELIAELHTEARWQKAVQHLTEQGLLEGSPRDIALLMREVPTDILKEEKDYIMGRLFGWAWKDIQRGATRGLAEWYKAQLLESAFTKTEAVNEQ